jgi:hypothetical protein
VLSPDVRPAMLRLVERRARHQLLDALVHVAEALFERTTVSPLAVKRNARAR